MKKSVKIISAFLGVSMFSFGVLKFVNPFKNWYFIQITTSNLPFPSFSYWFGQIGEIVCGLVFFVLLMTFKKMRLEMFKITFLITNVLVIGMMLVAFYVHIHPNVPNDVLPLKIKPPFIPAVFLIISVWNIFLSKKTKK